MLTVAPLNCESGRDALSSTWAAAPPDRQAEFKAELNDRVGESSKDTAPLVEHTVDRVTVEPRPSTAGSSGADVTDCELICATGAGYGSRTARTVCEQTENRQGQKKKNNEIKFLV